MRPNRILLSLLPVLVAGVFLAGCGEDNLTGVNSTPLPESELLVEDPLDGVLNSTEGATPADHGMRVDRLAMRLDLDEEQKAALIEAYKEFHDGLKALREQVRSGEMTLEDAREAAAALREAFEAQLQLILTPEQYEQLQEMRQNRDGRGHGIRDPHQRWLDWLEEIGATEDQIAQVIEAIRAMHDALEDVHEAFRAGEITAEEAREQVMQIRADFEAALQEILTPEQYEDLLELRPDHRGKHHGNGRHGDQGGNGRGNGNDQGGGNGQGDGNGNGRGNGRGNN